MDKGHISLSEALKIGRLQDFIAQNEGLEVSPVSKRQFDAVVKKAVKVPPPQGQTSGSRARGGSSGKKTR